MISLIHCPFGRKCKRSRLKLSAKHRNPIVLLSPPKVVVSVLFCKTVELQRHPYIEELLDRTRVLIQFQSCLDNSESE